MPDQELLRALTLPESLDDAPILTEAHILTLSCTPFFHLGERGIALHLLEIWNLSNADIKILSLRLLDDSVACVRWPTPMLPLKVFAQSKASIPLQAYRVWFGEREGTLSIRTNVGELQCAYKINSAPPSLRSPLWEVWPRYLLQTNAGYVDEHGAPCKTLFLLSQAQESLHFSLSIALKEQTQPWTHIALAPLSNVEIDLPTDQMIGASSLRCMSSSSTSTANKPFLERGQHDIPILRAHGG